MQLVNECSGRTGRLTIHSRRSPTSFLNRSNNNLKTAKDSSVMTGRSHIRKAVSVDRSTSSQVRPIERSGKFNNYENDIFVIPVHRVIAKPSTQHLHNHRRESLDGGNDSDIQAVNYNEQSRGVRILDIPKLHLESIDASISKSHDEDDKETIQALGAMPYVKPNPEPSKHTRSHSKSDIKINGTSIDIESPDRDGSSGEFLRINIQTCPTSTESSSEDGDTPRLISQQNLKPSKLFRKKNFHAEVKPRVIVPKPKIHVDRENVRTTYAKIPKPQMPITSSNTHQVNNSFSNPSINTSMSKEAKDKEHEMVCPHCKFRWNVNLQKEARKDLDYFKRRFNVDMPYAANSNNAYNSQIFSYINAAKKRAETAPVISMSNNNNQNTNMFICQHCRRNVTTDLLANSTQPICNNQNCQNFHLNKYKTTDGLNNFESMNQYCFHCCANPTQNSGNNGNNTAGSVNNNTQQTVQSNLSSSDAIQDLTNSYLSKNPIFNTIPRVYNNSTLGNPIPTTNQQPQQQTNVNNNVSSNNGNMSNGTGTSGTPVVSQTGTLNGQSGTQPNSSSTTQSYSLFNHNCKMYTPFAAINPWNTLRYVNDVTNVHGNTNRFVNTSMTSSNQFPTPYYWSQV